MCSFRTIPGLPGSDSEEPQTSTLATIATEDSREPSPATQPSAAARRNSKRNRSPQLSTRQHSVTNAQHATKPATNGSLEEVRKRTQRLELMMELMLEQHSKTELAALHSPLDSDPPQHSNAEQHGPDDELHAGDKNYSTSTGFLPLSKLMNPGKLSWAKPLEALGLQDRWSEICKV